MANYNALLTDQQSDIIRKAVYKFIDKNGYSIRDVCKNKFFIGTQTFSRNIGKREEDRKIAINATTMDIVDRLIAENILTTEEQCILMEAGIYKRK